MEQYNLREVTGPTDPAGASATLQNAVLVVNAASVSDGTAVPYAAMFINGADITTPTSTTIGLASGHIYSVSCIFEATTKNEGYVLITPRYSGTVQPDFAPLAVTNTAQSASSATATFIANAMSGALVLDFLYNGSVDATIPVGSVSIVEIQ